MEGICEVIIDEDDGEEWVVFDDNFNQIITIFILTKSKQFSQSFHRRCHGIGFKNYKKEL